jgi:Right handed beta helix region/Bacterial Ig-like domain (group 2)
MARKQTTAENCNPIPTLSCYTRKAGIKTTSQWVPVRHRGGVMKVIRLPLFVLTAGLMLLLTACPGGGTEIKPIVNSVALSQKPNSMKVGEVINLTATVDGTNLSDKSVSWSSDNTSFASVSRGTVTGVAKGQVTITATSNSDKSKSDSVTMNITQDAPLPTPNLEISPGNTEVGVGGGAVTFTATRTSITEGVTWTLTGPGSPSSGSGDSFVYTPPATATPGVTSATLTASAGGLSKQIAIEITQGSVISAVEITGYTASTQVRQGAGFIEVKVTGSGLAGANNAKLVEANLDGTTNTSNNTSATFSFTIPNGAKLGKQTLRISTNTDSALSKAEALELTPIVFSPTGSDTNKGTFESPFKTLAASFSASEGDIIHLTTGTYSFPTGNFFIVPNGVIVEGESRDGTILQSATAGNADGFFFSGGKAEIRNLTLKTFGVAIVAAGTDDVTLTNLKVSDSTLKALFVFNTAKVTITNSLFTRNAGDNIVVSDTGTLTISDSELSENALTGLWLTNSPTTTTDNPTATLNGVTVRGNNTQNTQWGGIQVSAGTLKVRGSTVKDDTGNGVRIDNYGGAAPKVVDFGTASEPGNNTIENNGQSVQNEWQIYDVRNARTATDGIVATFVGSSIGGLTNLGGPKIGADFFENAGINYWTILNANNEITFQ